MGLKPVPLLMLVVVATSLAQEKCCYPDQMEILDGMIIGTMESGKPVAVLDGIQAAFDYPNKRMGELVAVQEQAEVYEYQIIIDYNEGVEYIIHGQTKTCQRVPLGGANMTHCVPADALYARSFYVGDNKMTADVFNYDLKQGPIVGNVILSVSRGDCIPFSSTFIGIHEGTPMLYIGGFVNYTSGIKDPSKYFTVPKYCPKSFSRKPNMYNSFLHKLFSGMY